ncbi:MAG: GNAT family N-acetyltransferase [Anaerolineae bacterium]
MKISCTVRPARMMDRQAVAALLWDMQPHTDVLLPEPSHWDDSSAVRRWVAEEDGPLVGWAACHRYTGTLTEDFRLDLLVAQEVRGQGVGTRLLATVREEMGRQGARMLCCQLRDDVTAAMWFLERRGFRVSGRTWESRLDVATFDPAPWQVRVAGLAANGIDVRSLAQEKALGLLNPQRLYVLDCALELDVPEDEPQRQPSFDEWQARSGWPGYRDDCYFVARIGADYVGMSQLWDRGDGRLETGLTGVLRPYRRQGIALALKLAAVDFARREGFDSISVWNADANGPMLAVNGRLGFQRQPEWLTLELLL